jgi:dinuclear metal center YbgI/SA1388 family protein
MITLQEIYRYLDELLKVDEFSDYCPNGLQVEGGHEVRKIGTAVSANLETIEAAVSKGIDCLITHHGFLWKGDSLRITSGKKKKIELLLKNRISLLSYHLPLDAHREVGNNWRAAEELGWKSLEPFGMFGGAPIGVKGVIEGIHRQEFQEKLEAYYGQPAHSALGGPETIASAALISGGAYRSILEAANQGIDCFITGNFDEPAWGWAFEEGINFFSCGHSATEKIGPRALASHIAEKFSIQSEFIDIFNPF